MVLFNTSYESNYITLILLCIMIVTVIIFLLFLLIMYISYKLLKFNYITSNNSITGYKTCSKEVLEKYGKYNILNITIVKNPLTMTTIFLTMLAELPNFSPENYSKLSSYSHVGLILHIKYKNKYDKHIFIEKNNNINILENYSINKNNKLLFIPIKESERMTIKSLLKITKKNMGYKNYFNWNDIYKNNCQTFCLNLLETYKLLTEERKRFIKDNIDIKYNQYTLYLFNSVCYYYSLITNF